MTDDPDTGALKALQADQVKEQQRLAQEAEEPATEAQHQRRADKAKYLRSKLEERERSEQALDEE